MTVSQMNRPDFDETEAGTSRQENEPEETIDGDGPSCLVCGRFANTGHHYGVTACLGCKTFFRRVVLQTKQPKCKFKNKCRLEKNVNAKRLCRSCRYLKCKQVGMTENALHPSRDIIGRRRRNSDEFSSPISSPPSIPPQLTPSGFREDDRIFLQNICVMDTDIRTRTAYILGEPCNGDKQINFYNPSCNYSNVSVNNGIGPSLKVDIILLTEWVDRVPEFSKLSDKYKKHLMRRFCLRYTVTEHGLFTVQMPPHNNVWFLSDRTCLVSEFENIPSEIRNLLTPTIIDEQKLLAPFTSMLIHEVAEPLRRLKPSSIEIAVVKTLMLLKPTCLQDLSGNLATKEDIEIVQKCRNRIISGLHAHYIKIGLDVDQLCVRLGDILMLSGGIEVCADRALEEMHLLRVFKLSSFDQYSSDVIFGFSRDF